jgi:hypothetical protein
VQIFFLFIPECFEIPFSAINEKVNIIPGHSYLEADMDSVLKKKNRRKIEKISVPEAVFLKRWYAYQ